MSNDNSALGGGGWGAIVSQYQRPWTDPTEDYTQSKDGCSTAVRAHAADILAAPVSAESSSDMEPPLPR